METRLHRADIVVSGPVARVEVEAVFFNLGSQRIEGEYFSPIEADAFARLRPDYQRTENQGRTVRGGQSPAHLRGDRPSAARSCLARTGGFANVTRPEVSDRAKIESQDSARLYQSIRIEGGTVQFWYPLRSARPGSGRIAQLAVRVALRAEAPIRWFYSPTHALDIHHRPETELVAGFEQSQATADRDLKVY